METMAGLRDLVSGQQQFLHVRQDLADLPNVQIDYRLRLFTVHAPGANQHIKACTPRLSSDDECERVFPNKRYPRRARLRCMQQLCMVN
jgi:hypothetical protein